MPEHKKSEIYMLTQALEDKIKSSPNSDSDEFRTLFLAVSRYEHTCKNLPQNATDISLLSERVEALTTIQEIIPEIRKYNAPSVLNAISAELHALAETATKLLPEAKRAYAEVKAQRNTSNGIV